MRNRKLKVESLAFSVSVLIFGLFAFCLTSGVLAAQMESNQFKIQMPNLNFSSGSPSSTNFKLGFTAGQTGPGVYTSTGFIVRAGFWYLKTIIPFSFSVSPTTIDFGTLTANNPVTQTITLTVSAGGAGGYEVTAQENKPLTSSASNTIPDTTCDASDCDEANAATWSQDTTYGFGYTMHGNDVPTPFPTAGPAGNLYKQFADRSLNEIPEAVMSSGQVGRSRSSTTTLKVNISGTQSAGTYQNIITFIATPRY